jgi:MerR family transcriptional regulator, mercuric resistance operon regulatory protein
MTIGALARAGGVGVETVRYYQRRGLMPEPSRPAGPSLGGGVRRYRQDHVRRLRFIRSAKSAGFTLEEIGALLVLDASSERARAHDMARSRIRALDAKIAELTEAKAALTRLADACSAGGSGPCPIIAAFQP